MPAPDVVLLPLVIGLTLLALIATAFAWRRGRRARVAQGIGWALVPLALYLTGLLTLLWNGLTAVVDWASRLVLSPPVWIGFGLLAACVVLIVVGGILARRGGAAPVAAGRTKPVEPGRTTAVSGRQPVQQAPTKAMNRPGNQPAKQPANRADPVDEDMAEIEAILKNRGIN